MRSLWLILLSVTINFILGISLLFVALYAFIFISSQGVDIGEEMPFFYILIGIILIIFYSIFLIVPNQYLFRKTSHSNALYITINLISFGTGIFVAINIFKNWS